MLLTSQEESMVKEKTSKLKKSLWQIFSRYIRHRDNWTCITCGKYATGAGMHAGHYIPKSVGGIELYFDEENVHAQCYHCNINLSGNSDIYLQFLLKKYGKKTIDRIRKLRYSTSRSWAPDIYKKKISYYKNILKQYE